MTTHLAGILKGAGLDQAIFEFDLMMGEDQIPSEYLRGLRYWQIMPRGWLDSIEASVRPSCGLGERSGLTC